MNPDSASAAVPANPPVDVWKDIVAQYQQPSLWRALWQIANTVLPYAGLWWLMYYCRNISWWLVIPIAVLAGGFLVRTFIIFHDCCHGSFFKSNVANDSVGFVTGLLAFTPYFQWRWEHNVHHSSCGDLDRRGTGDVWTMTVQEYLEASRWKKFSYRLARNPVVLFIIAPVMLFLFLQRVPNTKASRRERHSVWAMNAALLAFVVAMISIFGVRDYLILQTLVVMVAGGAGVWMFYVQHQFEDVYWERADGWDYTAAALQGSSFYKLPRVLQWFTGNIGYHHIHHLSPRIPNYHLEKCHYAHPLFQRVKPVTFFTSLKSLGYRLWDEENRRLVGYGFLKTARK
jgi:acyl-lipid omega-6 desaturase (Delta-12 desaturase)